MLLIPSIDLRGGQCVRLLKGDFGAETRYARRSARTCCSAIADAGATWLHVVDLDGARDGRPGNRQLIRDLAERDLRENPGRRRCAQPQTDRRRC